MPVVTVYETLLNSTTFDLRTWPNLIGLEGPENTDAAWFHSVGWLLPELLHSIIKIREQRQPLPLSLIIRQAEKQIPA
uniref:Uncharacterized protein n=1 Tax=Picea glauca TaxID=3330 RepID=A0A101LZR6_PICGL|nr:hypothetical protein ABT39_MTgene5324 [Picea glauca]